MTSPLAGAASQWYRHSFQLKRTNGFYERGYYRKLDTELSHHKGNVQPASQAQVERLPEGARADGAITVFTCLDMRTSESPNVVADRIMWHDVEYEIISVEKWASHSEYLCTKVSQ